MIYVRERNADSICVTELWFLVMKSPYMFIHFGGKDSALGTCRLAILSESIMVLAMRDCTAKMKLEMLKC